MERYSYNQVMKTLEKLFKTGFDTDKKILSLKLEDLEKFSNLQSSETLILIELKKAIKKKEIISFLSSCIDMTEKEDKT